MTQDSSDTRPPSADHASTPLFALLYRPGPAWVTGRPMRDQALGSHKAFVKALFDHGRVTAAGPFLDDSGGLALLRASSREEAEAVLAADPAVAGGILVGEVRPWHPLFDRATRAGAAQSAEVVRQLFAAVERRDLDGFLRAYDEGVVVHEAPSLPYGGEYRGLEGLQRHALAYTRAWDELQGDEERRLEPEFVAEGDRVVVLWRQRARDPVNGDSFDMPAVSVYQLRDGRVIETRMFHFDTAAVRDFLDRAHVDAPVDACERELNALIARGEYAWAFERFYSADVLMQEAGGRETAGKAANRAREGMFFRALERIEGRLLGEAVAGATAYSEWEYRIDFRSGRTLEYRQVAARVWSNGRVVSETFYHEPFPEWMMDEIRATAAADPRRPDHRP